MEQWCFCCQAIDREWFTQERSPGWGEWGGGGAGARGEPGKCWIMGRQSWNGDTILGQLLFITSPGEFSATEESWEARRCLGVRRHIWAHQPGMNQLSFRSSVTTWDSGHSTKPLSEWVWLGMGWASICPAWNLDPFAPVCINMSKDDRSDVLWELIPRTAEWPSLQREYLHCVLFTPWL